MRLADDAFRHAPAATYRTLIGRRVAWLGVLAAAIVVSVLVDFVLGPAGLRLDEVLGALFARDAADPVVAAIVWDVRLPYGLMAVAVGLALGLAGAEMQTVLDNPLASPFTLGLSSAAALGAALGMVLGAGLPGVPAAWLVPVNAFVFAMLSALLLDVVARRAGLDSAGVVLFGIALVFSFNALVSLLQFMATAEVLQGLVFWTLGSLARATWWTVGALALCVALVLPFALRDAWRLSAMRLGEERAASFGVDVRRLRRRALVRIALLAALAVAFAGTIGFIGLIAPHIARRVFGEDHRFYLPGSALVGALILSLASIASRNLMPGLALPVGIVTALVGIPFFLAVVFRRRVA